MSRTHVTPPRAFSRPGAPLPLVGLHSSPLHGELLGVDRLEERARTLAAGFTLSRNPRRGPPSLLRHLTEDTRVLRTAYQILAGDVRSGEPVAPAAEWLLDNFHLVEGEIREIRHHLPTRYYLRAPETGHARARRDGAHLRHGCRAPPLQRRAPRPAPPDPIHLRVSDRRTAHASASCGRGPAC